MDPGGAAGPSQDGRSRMKTRDRDGSPGVEQ